jgi:small subunit ribosomal protein S4
MVVDPVRDVGFSERRIIMGLSKGSVCKLCRREGAKLFLKGDRCDSPKCALTRRSYPPGAQGAMFKGKMSEYGIRLREKQKAKRFYYVSESQFRRYYRMADNMHGDTGEKLLQIVERRLDNVVYKVGLVKTRKHARQFVRHGHVEINGKKVDIPSYLMKEKDVLTVRGSSAKLVVESEEKKTVPVWIVGDEKAKKYEFSRIPSRDEIEVPINEQFVIEYYSR